MKVPPPPLRPLQRVVRNPTAMERAKLFLDVPTSTTSHEWTMEMVGIRECGGDEHKSVMQPFLILSPPWGPREGKGDVAILISLPHGHTKKEG